MSHGGLVEHVAFAIYRTFTRNLDPEGARLRFERLKPASREQYENEARAAIEAVDEWREVNG